MTQRKLKFAVVGCGRVSERHHSALTSGLLPAELVAICDLDAAKAKAKSEKLNVPFYTDYHEMLRHHPDIDVINVATPTGYHARHVIDLARYGKHIIVEKPMALRVEDCNAMIAACAKGGGRLFVVKQNRFNRAVVAARRAFEEGRFGKMVVGAVKCRWKRDQYYYEQDNWHGTWALDGGVMSQQASHHLDLLQWFMGPIDDMSCFRSTRLMKIEVEDTAVAMFKFASGSLGTFEATVATRPEDMGASLSLLGEKGSVVIEGSAVNELTYWKFQDRRPEDETIIADYSQAVPNCYGHGHGPYIGNVIEAILENKPGLVEASEGKKNIEILTALYESSFLNGAVVKPGCPVNLCPLGRQ